MPIGAAFLHIGQVITSAENVNDIIAQKALVSFDEMNNLNKQNNL